MKERILVVEDNEAIGTSIREILALHGYSVSLAENTREARRILASENPDLILLDVMLPGENGVEFLHRLREKSDVPVLFLTAMDGEDIVVEGLNAGADDYIVKPFRTMELLARIQAVMRRRSTSRKLVRYTSGPLTIDLENHLAMVGTQRLDLTNMEYYILRRVMAGKGVVITRSALTEMIWEKTGHSVEDNTLTVAVSRLRVKLGEADGIQTRRGLGYFWTKRVDEVYE